MQFRCYSCGYVFADGIPPFEALGKAQAGVVGRDYEGDPTRRLCEALSNLSVFNFCAFCAQFVSYQLVWEDHPEHSFVHGDWNIERRQRGVHRCGCGELYNSEHWQWINRAKILHKFTVYYSEELSKIMFRDLEMEG